jgi:hypothetical protein
LIGRIALPATGEGCFLIRTTKNTQSVTLRFKLTQHIRDKVLMKYLEQYLGCGTYYSSENICDFVVSNFFPSASAQASPGPEEILKKKYYLFLMNIL